MEPPNPINSISHDGEGKPYRYRRRAYPTFFWLMRHQGGPTKQPELFKNVLVHIVVLIGALLFIGTLLFQVVFVTSFREIFQSPGTGLAHSIFWLSASAMLVFMCYFHAWWMRHFAVAFDLKAKICPACGYPLTHQDKDDSPANMLCTECGRRWTVAERTDIIEKRRSTPQPDSKTDATD